MWLVESTYFHLDRNHTIDLLVLQKGETETNKFGDDLGQADNNDCYSKAIFLTSSASYLIVLTLLSISIN